MPSPLFKRPGTKTFRITDQDGLVICNSESSCFNDLIHKLDEFEVRKLAIISHLNEAPFCPDFELFLGRKDLVSFTLSGSGMPNDDLAQDFDFNVFRDFASVTELTLSNASFRGQLAGLFPKVARLSLTWPENPMRDLGTNWPDLTWVRLDRFKGAISDLGPLAALTDLRLYRAGLSSLAGIAEQFPQLETLIIEGQRKELDVSPLAACKNLKNLKFDAFTKTKGIETLHVPSLEAVIVSKLAQPDFVELNPQLKFMRAKKFLTDPTDAMLRQGWEQIEGEQGIGGWVIPEALRK